MRQLSRFKEGAQRYGGRAVAGLSALLVSGMCLAGDLADAVAPDLADAKTDVTATQVIMIGIVVLFVVYVLIKSALRK